MRTETEMLCQILQFARQDNRIRLVGMEGSRANPNAPKDLYQDYDISYLVTDMASFLENDHWLDFFGRRAILQKPEAMELYPPELGNWFSYLILFEDGPKLDLTLIPLEELPLYVKGDGLLRILLDKDNLVPHPAIPTDRNYHITRPSARSFDDCCNEFWLSSTYVAKGLCRREPLFAADLLHSVVRPCLLQMLSWQVCLTTGYGRSMGKSYKLLPGCLPPPQADLLLQTYRNNSEKAIWNSLLLCLQLFRSSSKALAHALGYAYPGYDDAVTRYTAAYLTPTFSEPDKPQ